MRKIFVDMDGVLADFDGGFRRMFNIESSSVSDDEMWALIAGRPGFFADLEPLPGAIEMVKILKGSPFNTMVLTAVPRAFAAAAEADKLAWLKKRFKDNVPAMVAVKGGKNKAHFVGQDGDILIDDWRPNLDAWDTMGGFGIKHRDPMDTINRVRLFMPEVINNAVIYSLAEPSWNIRKAKAEKWLSQQPAEVVKAIEAMTDSVELAIGYSLSQVLQSNVGKVKPIAIDIARTAAILILRKGASLPPPSSFYLIESAIRYAEAILEHRKKVASPAAELERLADTPVAARPR